ncbi:lytic murein transglycosylase B [Limnobacter humi]|uniref:Lytic murein transglycosylase B n=1 Tax=Limnobacter humi TaxID=1778671 RepID=A0ABT1WBJ6_9BURK|nr:lytic murein transglycosylase B [Limnobacter humi]MCQ8894889.1 lytic murein transglycosylase B [Limnobacter humi]
MPAPSIATSRWANVLIVLTAFASSQAAVAQAVNKAADNSNQAEQASAPNAEDKARQWASQLEISQGIPASYTLKVLSEARYQPKVVEAVKPPKTPTVRNWDTYRGRFVEPIRIRKGVKFWLDHEEALKQAETQYGVPQEVIVAIIGVETIYGEHTGNFRVLDALSTLGFAYPQGQKDRSAFFQDELGAFFVLCQKMKLDPLEVKGSYAGAVGLGQFMPSSWLNFAVDGNGDGGIDLFHSRQDAIFSVANFLNVHGWQPGKAGRVLIETPKTPNLTELLAPDILPTFTTKTLTDKGLILKTPTQADELLAVVELARGDDPPAYVVGGQNFYAVTRYNRSAFYANAVLELAEALALRKKLTPGIRQSTGNDRPDRTQ